MCRSGSQNIGIELRYTFLDRSGSQEQRLKGARVTFQLPAEDNADAARVFHNRLMMLCGVGYRGFCEAISKKSDRSKKKQPAEVQPPDQQPAAPAAVAPVAAEAAAPGPGE